MTQPENTNSEKVHQIHPCSSKNGNTFINFGGPYPHQTFTGWIPKGSELANTSTLAGPEGKKLRITGTFFLVFLPGNSESRFLQ
jgi:hypothetical protein